MAQQNKEQQKKLLSEVMEADQKNGLYDNHIVETNKMVTAVEWLVKIYLQTKKIDSFDIEQAKQMDKARIIDAFNKGEIQGLKSTNNSFHSSLITAEEYYNQTYGKE